MSEERAVQPFQVVERGVKAQQQYDPCTDLSRMHYSPRYLQPPKVNFEQCRVHYRSLDIAGWVLLGSCISLVIILGGTTWHYRSPKQYKGKMSLVDNTNIGKGYRSVGCRWLVIWF